MFAEHAEDQPLAVQCAFWHSANHLPRAPARTLLNPAGGSLLPADAGGAVRAGACSHSRSASSL
eukprot:4047089-Pleurochrysis_carterae.AAC.1